MLQMRVKYEKRCEPCLVLLLLLDGGLQGGVGRLAQGVVHVYRIQVSISTMAAAPGILVGSGFIENLESGSKIPFSFLLSKK